MSGPYQPSLEQIRRAVEISEHITRLQNDLDRLLSSIQKDLSVKGNPAGVVMRSFQNLTANTPPRAERSLSREARERIAEAQRRRWERVRNNKSAELSD